MSTTSLLPKVSNPVQRRSISQNNVNPLLRESIKVMVRFRPCNKQEKAWDKQNRSHHSNSNKMEKIEFLPKQQLQICNRNGKRFTYNFDTLLKPSTSQRQVFAAVAEQTCDDILQGYNGTIFVYGQSGSGKTYSMYGPEERKDEMDISSFGIIPMSCAYIFAILNDETHPLTENLVSYTVRCEFIEIYNEKLNDLLDPNKTPHIRELLINKEYVPVIENVTTKQVQNLEECIAAIRMATGNRTVAYTNLNATSSRSHMVMRLIVTLETEKGIKKTGIANFADLAGSEKVKKTGVQGKQLKEAGNILKSLSALSNVIDALEKGRKHVPFKDSKLTFMLSNSLGGNCKTILLLCGSAHALNRDESIRSIQFGMRCRNVQNTVSVNETRTKQQLLSENKQLKAQVEALKLNQLQLDKQELVNEKLSEYEQRNSELLRTIANNEEHVNTLTQQLHAMNEQNAEVLARESEITKEYQMLQEMYTDLESHAQVANAASEVHLQQQQQLDQNYEDVNAENIELKSVNASLQTRLHKACTLLSTLNDELHECQHKLELEQQQTQALDALVRTLRNESKKQMESAKQKHAQLLLRLSKKQSSQETQSRHSAQLTLDVDVKARENVKLRDEHDALLLEVETMKIEVQKLHKENEGLNASLQRHKSRRQTFDSENLNLQQQHATLRSEYEALTKKLSKLQNESSQERAKHEQNIQHLQSTIETQRDRLQKATTRCKESDEKVTRFEAQIAAYQSTIEEQSTSLKWLNAEKQEWVKQRQREMHMSSTSMRLSVVSITAPSSSTLSLQASSMRSLQSIEPSISVAVRNPQQEAEEKEESEPISPASLDINNNNNNNKVRAMSMADWDAMVNSMNPRTRRSAFRSAADIAVNAAPTLSNNNNNNNQRKSKKRKQYKKRSMTTKDNAKPGGRPHIQLRDAKSGEHADDEETEDDEEPVLNKYLSRDIAHDQMGEQEVIVRRQTIALGSYFENHVQKRRQTIANEDEADKHMTPEGAVPIQPLLLGPSESSLSLNEPLLRYNSQSDLYEALERAENDKENNRKKDAQKPRQRHKKREHHPRHENKNDNDNGDGGFRELSSSESDHIDPSQELQVESPRFMHQSSVLQEIEGAIDTHVSSRKVREQPEQKSDDDSMAARLRREHLEKLQEEWAMADSTEHASPKRWLAKHPQCQYVQSGPLHAHPAFKYASHSVQEGVADNIVPKAKAKAIPKPIIHHGHSASANGSLNAYQLNKAQAPAMYSAVSATNSRRSMNVPHSGASYQPLKDATHSNNHNEKKPDKLKRHQSHGSPSAKDKKHKRNSNSKDKFKNKKEKRKSSSPVAKPGKMDRLGLLYDDNYDSMKESYQKRKRAKQRFLSADVSY